MLQNNDRANKFVEAITKEALEKKAIIENEINEFVASEMKEAELAALSESYNMIQKAGARIHSDSSSKISAGKLESKRKLLARRAEMVGEVIGGVAGKLAEFTASAEYADFLAKSAAAGVDYIGGDAVVYMCAADEKFADIVRAQSDGFTVEITDDIKIGGLRFSDRDNFKIADDTLDKRLETGRAWFMKNSDLALKE